MSKKTGNVYDAFLSLEDVKDATVEELNEALVGDEESDILDESYSAFEVCKDGSKVSAIGTYHHTRNYTHEIVEFSWTGGKGEGTYKWMNRPWQRFDFAEALKTAMINAGVGKETAKDTIEHSNSLDSAIKYFAEHSCDIANDKNDPANYSESLKDAVTEEHVCEKCGKNPCECKEVKESITDDLIDVYDKAEAKIRAIGHAIDDLEEFWNSDEFVRDTIDSFNEYYPEGWHSLDEVSAQVANWADEIQGAKDYQRDVMQPLEDKSESLEECDKKVDEAPVSTLEPEYDSRQSFYGKAHVDDKGNGTKVLYSYNTPVAMIKDGEVTLAKARDRGYPFLVWRVSPTTLRHVKEFLKQNGFKADSLAQMSKDYKSDFINESLQEEVKANLMDKEEVEKAKEYLEADSKEPVEQIVDVDAETVDDLKDSYIGNVILRCPTCKSLSYRKPEAIKKDEETGKYNVEETCTHCGAEGGFEIVGQVATADVNTEEPATKTGVDEPEAVEDKTTEINIDAVEEQPAEEEKKEESLEKKTTTVIEESKETEVCEELDETTFDTLVNNYINEVYDDVEKYTSTDCKQLENKDIVIEGNLKFKNGTEKQVSFTLSESKKSAIKENKIRYVCTNEALTKTPKAFSLVCNKNENKLVCESLGYKYTVNEQKVFGKVKIK